MWCVLGGGLGVGGLVVLGGLCGVGCGVGVDGGLACVVAINDAFFVDGLSLLGNYFAYVDAIV